YYEEITDLDPDLLVAYGCSIVRGPLLSEFRGRFLNVHLGLSPYYRGTGTNFWPLVNGEPEYVGATFMYIDEGVDTGEIVHQIRARVYPDDTPHQVGNRLIADMTRTYIKIVRRFDALKPVDKPSEPEDSNYYRRDDYTTEATRKLYQNFGSGLVERYLEEREDRIRAVPIVSNPALDDFDVAADSSVEL
ncbi:MAG: formyltransferase family protein, partial [Natronomonas sp.]|nr:formyltransferase family protein [Natronomonas sp.]